MRGANDEDVAKLAKAEGKVIITMDKDFGRIALGMKIPGLLLIRIPEMGETNNQ